MPLQLQSESEGRVLSVHGSGKLTKEDYLHFVPEVDRLIEEHGPVNMLFEMHDFHGWEMAAVWEDTKFAFHHFHDIARLAVVGENRWQKGMSVFCKPFTRAEVRYFDHAHVEEARAWLLEQPVGHAN